MSDFPQCLRPSGDHRVRDDLPLGGKQLWQRIKRELDSASAGDRFCSLLYLSVNGYTATAHREGPAAADHLVEDVARVLTRECRAGHTLARFRNDQLGLFLPGSDAEAAEAIVHGTTATMADLSFGVVTWRAPGVTLETIAQTAYQAMYECRRTAGVSHRHLLISDGAAALYTPAAEPSQPRRGPIVVRPPLIVGQTP